MKAKSSYMLAGVVCFVLVFSMFGGLGFGADEGRGEFPVDSMAHEYSFSKLNIESAVGGSNVWFTECGGYTTEVGAPTLPYFTAHLLLPQGKTYSSIEVTGHGQIISENVFVPWSQSPVILDLLPAKADTPRDLAIYTSTSPYPGVLHSEPNVQGCRGMFMLVFNLYPVQYIPVNGILQYYDTLEVSIGLVDGPALGSALQYRGLASDKNAILSLVDNPEILQTYSSDSDPILKSGGNDDSILLDLGSWDMVIITDETFTDEFQPLVDHRNSRGIATTTYTVQDIYSGYSGIDDQDEIRDFIIDAYNQWGVEYVLLGVDALGTGVQKYLPHRGLYANVNAGAYQDSDIPSDMYYSCLDGPWNNDGDSDWGEYNDGAGGGIPDYYHDVYLGRAPVSTSTDVTTFVNKVIGYENTARSKKVTLHGAYLWAGASGKEIKTIGCSQTGNKGVDDYIPLDWTEYTLYEPDDGTTTKAEWEAEFAAGRQIINHGGHGSTESYQVSNSPLVVSYPDTDADDIVNSEKGIHLSIACYSGAFDGRETSVGSYATDRDCMAEEYIINPSGGFVATVLNTRYGWGSSSPGSVSRWSGELDIDWYHQLFDNGHNRIGNTTAKARENIAPEATSNFADNCHRWCMYEWNLLGDPAMEIMQPPQVTVTQPNTAVTWVSGTSETITWSATTGSYSLALNPISIYYSTTGPGGPWTLISNNEPNDGTYTWNPIPGVASSNCYVKVSARDSQIPSLSGSDFSDVAFTISSVQPPQVTVTQPNTAVSWSAGSSHAITWTATAGTNPLAANPITIYYSYDDPEGDGPWTQITTNEPNDGTYTWDPVPDTQSTSCYVMVEAVDTMAITGSDVSDTAFTIDFAPPSVLLTSPDGGEFLMGGGSWDITWVATAGSNPLIADPITIEYSSTGPGGPWNFIATNEPNDGTYTWDPIPTLDASNCYVRVTVEDTIGITGNDVSDGSFTIDSTVPLPASNPNAELTAPNNVIISWIDSISPDVDHYEVYYVLNGWDSTGDSYNFLVDTGLTTSYQHNNVGINNPSSYYWQVRTYDAAGNEARTTIQAGKTSSIQSTFTNPSGWFMLGSHLVQSDTSLAHVIQGQGLPANRDNVQLYDAVNGEWHSNIVGRPDSLDDLWDITNEQGFWLHVTASTRFATAGYVEDMSISLTAGWNLVPYPFAERTMSTANIMTHLSVNCPNYDGMEIFDSGAAYRLKIPDGTETLAHGSGFWVKVTADTTWTVLNY